jgi:hypothetical protein
MSEFLSSTELFINVKNPPRWNPKKNYFDQSVDVLDFYLEEKRKITEGVTIGGYYIHPWLYWHMNFFKTPIPIPGKNNTMKEEIMVPPLDDNFLYLIENYKEAEEKNLGLMIFGARGFAKSTSLASLITWLNSTKVNGTTSIIGGSDPDLKSLSKLLSIGFNTVHPALFIPQLISEWDSKIELGIKEKDGFRLPHSHVSIVNANKGTSKSSEKGAGLSPVGFIIDEAGKFACKQILQSALPSFQTQYGSKLVPILSGTSGNVDLSKDAKDILTNPEAFKLLPMNWDRLDRRVDPDSVTWNRSKKDKFSIFVPGQMSYRLPVLKVKTSLSDYLGIDNQVLKSVVVNETNWEAATEHIRSENAAYLKEEDREKNRMYFPLEIADVFITSATNLFPTSVIDAHIRMLEDTGRLGKNVELYRSGTELKSEFTAKKRAEVSHGGGEADAPVIVYGEIPVNPPPKFTFVSGLDDYKLEQSDTDSLGAYYILKRRGLTFDSPCETIAASFTSRPFRHSDFHRTIETMLDGWNAVCCMEAVDVSFKQFLDTKNKAGQCLAPGISFSNSAQSNGYNGNTKYGIYPTVMNQRYMFDLVVDYCKEEHVLGIDNDGNQIIKMGVEYIEDIDLLKEMLNYKKGGNFDRLTAFMHALAYARELDKDSVKPKEVKKVDPNMYQQPKKVRLSVFGSKRPNAF